MTIRRLTPDDWAAFRDIRLEMLRTAPAAFGSTHADWAAKPEGEIREWLCRMHAFGLFSGADLWGCAACRVAGGARVRHRASVIAVYLRPAARGQGHTRRLLAALAAAARADGVLQLELDVTDTNRAAIAAYERAGFVATGATPRALRLASGFADAVTMIRRLDD
jgi:GNAT superfamily N-acetyltransferase